MERTVNRRDLAGVVLGFQENNHLNDDVMLDSLISYITASGHGDDMAAFLKDRFTVKRCGYCANQPVAWMTWKTIGHGGSKSAPVCAPCMTQHDRPDNYGERPDFKAIVPVVT